MRTGLYWAVLGACLIGFFAGVAELLTTRYFLGIATMVLAVVVGLATLARRSTFARPAQSLDEMKATTRSIPPGTRIELTVFCVLLLAGGITGILFAAAEIQHGAAGLGLLIGLPSAFFALAGASGAVAFWLPKNRGET